MQSIISDEPQQFVQPHCVNLPRSKLDSRSGIRGHELRRKRSASILERSVTKPKSRVGRKL